MAGKRFIAFGGLLAFAFAAQAQAGESDVPTASEAAPVAIAAPASAPAAEAPPARIASSVFARRSFLRGPKLSPDGTRIVSRVNMEGKEAIGIMPLTGGEKPVLFGIPDKFDLNWYRWAGNGTLLISLGQTVPWFDDEAWSTRLISFDIAAQKGTFLGEREQGLTGDDVLWVDPEGKTLLLSYQKRSMIIPLFIR